MPGALLGQGSARNIFPPDPAVVKKKSTYRREYFLTYRSGVYLPKHYQQLPQEGAARAVGGIAGICLILGGPRLLGAMHDEGFGSCSKAEVDLLIDRPRYRFICSPAEPIQRGAHSLYTAAAEWPSGNCAGVVRELCGSCAGVVRELCGSCAEKLRELCGSCAGAVRELCGKATRRALRKSCGSCCSEKLRELLCGKEKTPAAEFRRGVFRFFLC